MSMKKNQTGKKFDRVPEKRLIIAEIGKGINHTIYISDVSHVGVLGNPELLNEFTYYQMQRSQTCMLSRNLALPSKNSILH